MRSFRHPRWQHLDYRVKVATTQENKPPTQGTRQWTFTTPRWRCGSILLPSLNTGVPESTGGHDRRETGQHQNMANDLTCPAGLQEPRNSPTGTALAQGSCANGTDHADSLRRRHALVDGQGRRSTRPSFQFCQVVNSLSTSCQPVNDRDQTAHQAMQTSSFDHSHCKHGYHWSRKVDSGLMTYLSVYCHDEQQVRFRKRQQASLLLKQLYCCLYQYTR